MIANKKIYWKKSANNHSPADSAHVMTRADFASLDNLVAKNSVPEITPNQKAAHSENHLVPVSSTNQVPQREMDNSSKPSQTPPLLENRYLLGAEIALAAVIASAGVARVRSVVTKSPDTGSMSGVSLQADQISSDKCGTAINESLYTAGNTSAHGDKNSVDSESLHSSSVAPIPHCDSTKRSGNPKSAESKLLADPLAVANPDTDESEHVQQPNLPAPRLRPTTLVAPRDTLVSIAEAFFHDPNIAWLIADLNKNRVKESWIDGKRIIEIRTRQQIDLPVWDDINEFYRDKSATACPNNVITIVEQSSVDRELITRRLKKIIDPAMSF